MPFGLVVGRIDRVGNSIAYPDGRRGLVFLSGSIQAFLPAGMTVEYEQCTPGNKPGIEFSELWGCVDASFYDCNTGDGLIIGRFGNQRMYSTYDHPVIKRIESVIGSMPEGGIIEETAPRVAYFKFKADSLKFENITRVLRPNCRVAVKARFPGIKCDSLLIVPHAPDPDRYNLAEMLQEYIMSRT